MESEGRIISDTNTRRSKRITFGVVVALLLLMGGYAAYYALRNADSLLDRFVASEISLREQAGGVIYFTAQGTEPNMIPSRMTMIVATGALFQFTSDEAASTYTEHLSANRNMSVYARLPILTGVDGWHFSTSSQITAYDIENDTEQVLTGTPLYKSNPEWSPDGGVVAYMATEYESAIVGDADTEMWDVYTVDIQTGTETYITRGTYPQWFPDGIHLLIMRNDGLHVYNTETQTDMHLSDTPLYAGTVKTSMKIDLSRDGSKIAWTLPSERKVLLLAIDTPENPNVVVQKEIATRAFWPVFSEGGRYLILHEEDLHALDTGPNPRLVLYDLETNVQEQILDFPGIRPESIAITDWRN